MKASAAALLPLIASALLAGEAAPKPRLGSRVFSWEELAVKATPSGLRRDVANHSTTTLTVFESHITTLRPGQASHAPHRHPQEELIIVREGQLEISINGAKQRAGAGSVFFYASIDAHAVRNIGDTPATYWVINLTTPATLQTPLPSPTWDSAPLLRSTVIDWEKLPVKPTKVGARRELLNGPTTTLVNLEGHVTTVNAGEAPHAPHRHPDDEFILVREGTLEVMVEGNTSRATTGSVIFLSSNDLHGLRNVGSTPATYFVFRAITSLTPKAAPGSD
jgi:quercetin dioxygenase-like cupin family protein